MEPSKRPRGMPIGYVMLEKSKRGAPPPPRGRRGGRGAGPLRVHSEREEPSPMQTVEGPANIESTLPNFLDDPAASTPPQSDSEHSTPSQSDVSMAPPYIPTTPRRERSRKARAPLPPTPLAQNLPPNLVPSPSPPPPNPDSAPVARSPYDLYLALHSLSVVRLVLFVIVFLHTRYQVSFRACATLLFCLDHVFRVLRLTGEDGTPMEPIPRTLQTLLTRLELHDHFSVFPVCYVCHRIFVDSKTHRGQCPDCTISLYKSTAQSFMNPLKKTTPKPRLVAPIQPLSSLLKDLLMRAEIEHAIDEWRIQPSKLPKLTRIQDGNVWKTIKGADGKAFFDHKSLPKGSNELRIGVTMSLDWFGRKTSSYGPSHSSGVLSFTIANLKHSLRYRTNNVLISLMTPGPTEPTSEQLQHYLKLIIDDLLKLYDDGIVYRTHEHPQGRRVRVVLLGVICDHPAMCKMAGVGDHSHKEAPCTKCTVTGENMKSNAALKNEFLMRDGEELRRQAFEYRGLKTDEEKEVFFKEHGVRWTELARLPYFDLVRHVIIDPMHNLLLGVAKSQWYQQWIAPKALRSSTDRRPRELELIHDFLESFESPLWAGRLPLRVGEPAGGSLTADEYKFAITVPWPIIIPIVWDNFLPESDRDFTRAKERYRKELDEHKKALASAQRAKSKKLPLPPKEPRQRMQPNEPGNLLRLASAFKILLGSSVEVDSLRYATELLQDYLCTFRELYGEDGLRPNHHWAVHVPDQILDYGPVYNFWTFLTERLNKVLKNMNSNNWTGGDLEVSMMREFSRTSQLDGILNAVLANTHDNLTHLVVKKMMGTNSEAIGTVADSAREPTSASYPLDDSRSVVVGTRVSEQPTLLSDAARASLLKHYTALGRRVHHALDRRPDPSSTSLIPHAYFYNFVMLDGRRLSPVDRTARKSAGSSLVMAAIHGQQFTGEVIRIFSHHQFVDRENVLFAEMAWMKRLDEAPCDDPWRYYSEELGVEFFELGQYHGYSDNGPPAIIQVRDIQCQVARGTIQTTVPEVWVTTTLDRHISIDVDYIMEQIEDED